MNQISFRDPDGFLIEFQEKLYRIVLTGWNKELEILKDDFYEAFSIPFHKMVSKPFHDELTCVLNEKGLVSSEIAAIFEVEKLNLITYPWEWTPVMLINAGIFTLNLQKKLMTSGLGLKDASFFNIQFESSKVLFVDLLSVKYSTRYYPWIPYGQFLRHFVYPSALLKYGKVLNLKLLWNFIDGIDLQFVSRLIPAKLLLNMYEFFHFTVASYVRKDIQKTYNKKAPEDNNSEIKLINLLDWNIRYLERIRSKLKKKNSYWAEYYKRDVASDYYDRKSELIRQLLATIPVNGRVLDLGSNIGEYSLLFLNYFDELICLEKDTVCCEIMYNNLSGSLPFGNGKKWHVINADIVNPDPYLGWMNLERRSLLDRIRSTLVSALGLTHHIYFTESIDFYKQADLFDKLSTKYLLLEFITSEDEKVKIISFNNPARLSGYNRESFIRVFNCKFTLKNSVVINSSRELFLFEKRNV